MVRLTTRMSIVPPESVGKATSVQSSSGFTQLHFHMEGMTKPEKESPHQSKYFWEVSPSLLKGRITRSFLSASLPEEAAGEGGELNLQKQPSEKMSSSREDGEVMESSHHTEPKEAK